jgi:hypothetical protein
MKRLYGFVIASMATAFLLLLPPAASAQSGAPDSDGAPGSAGDSLARIDSYRVYAKGGFSYDFETTEEDGQRSLMRVSVRLEPAEEALVKYLEPVKERGRAILVRGNAFWLYEPGMKNSLRISPRQLLFGQASAGDVSRISFNTMYDLVSTEKTALGFALRLKAKPNAGATYDLVDLETDAQERPLAAKCRGSSGTLMKTIRYDGYQSYGGKVLLVSFSIRDEIEGKTTSVRLGGYDASLPPESAYSIQALKNYR